MFWIVLHFYTGCLYGLGFLRFPQLWTHRTPTIHYLYRTHGEISKLSHILSRSFFSQPTYIIRNVHIYINKVSSLEDTSREAYHKGFASILMAEHIKIPKFRKHFFSPPEKSKWRRWNLKFPGISFCRQ